MGIARILKPENSNDTSGTPGYMGNSLKMIINYLLSIAPEVMCRQNHSFAVDYFALGVIGYEFMLGRVMLFRNYLLLIRDLIQEDLDWKLETKFLQNKFKSEKVICPMDGPWKVLTSLTEYIFEEY